jgi:thiamine-phosphate pyrophosphorylase
MLIPAVRRAVSHGVHLVQVREKDLPDGVLFDLVARVVAIAATTRCGVIVNGRFDLALAAGAHGVHLPEDGLPVTAVRSILPKGFLVGCSAHSLEAAELAARGGADYLLVSPVFATPSKAAYGAPLGIASFEGICRRIGIPVLGLGGIDRVRIPEVLRAGAAGVAGIRMFQGPFRKGGWRPW